jgi:hypothetical protein
LALARVLRHVPFEDAQTACYASLETFKEALQHAVQLMNFDSLTLDRWKKNLDEIEQIEVLQQKLVVTRAITLEAWQNPGMFGMAGQPYVVAAMGGVTKTIGTKDRVACEMIDQFEGAVQLAGESFQKCADRYATNVPAPPGPGLNFPFGDRAVCTVLSLEGAIRAQFQVLKTAIAVEKFRKAKRTMPSNLAQLVPKYLKEVPTDPFGSGAPLIFKTDKQNTLIYSISVNRQDDNGQAIGWFLNGDIGFKFSE